MLILKQNAANSVPTPPSGKGTIFLDDSDTLSVKVSDGNVQTFPTVGASNAQVVFMDGTTLTGENAFTYDFNTNILTVTGNVAAGNVLTNNLYYANGLPWDLQEAAGSNNQIQYNIGNNFAASANFTYNDSTQLFTVAGNAQFNNANAGNLLTANFVSGTLTTASQPNITTVGSLTNLNVSGNAVIAGNLTVDGNLVYVNVETLAIEDPIINLQSGPNGAAPTGNSGKDVGTALNYYDNQARLAFMGWDVSNAEFGLASQASLNNEVVTFSQYGNLRVNVIFANGEGLTNIPGGNIVGNISGNISNANYAAFAGDVVNSSQPNITSVGTLSSLSVTGNANVGNLGTAGAITATGNVTANYFIGNGSQLTGIDATAIQNGTANVRTFLNGNVAVSASGNANVAIVTGTGVNVAGTVNATGNVSAAFFIGNGSQLTGIDATTIQNGTANVRTFLNGNVAVSASGNANIVLVTGTGANINGTLNATGNANVGNLGSGGLITATGNVSGGNLTTGGALSVTGNANVGNIGATAGVFTGNISSLNANLGNLVTANYVNVAFDLNVAGNANIGSGSGGTITGANLLSANFIAGTLTTASQPNITSVGTLSSLSVTGNVAAGNLSTSGTLSVTGNANVGNIGATGVVATTLGGTLTTASQPNITSVGTLSSLAVTGNASAGNLSTSGTLSVTGNANVGNIGATGVVATTLGGTLTTASQPNITSVGTLTSLGVNGTVTAVAFTANTGVFTGNGSGLSAIAGANVTGQVGNALVAGTVYTNAQPNITSVGTLTGLNVNGNITAANITANTGVFTGNGSGLTALAGANVTGQVANALVAGTVYTNAQPNITSVGTLSSLAVTGNATAGNVYANSGTVGASLLTGTLTTAAQPNITSIGTLSSLSVTGNVAAGNLTTTGILSVTGTGTSSIAGNLDMTSNNITNLAEPVNATDAATKAYVDSVAEGLHTHDSCNAATTGTLATISGGTVTYDNGTNGVGATLTTTGSYTTIDGVTLSDGMRILVKDESNAAHNGIYVRTSSTVLTRATDFDTPAEMAGGDFTFVTEGTLYDNTGWVMTDAVTTVGTSPVNWTQFSGAGTYTAGTGLTLTGSQFSVNASQTQITAVGTLTGLSVNGNITAANITANTGVFTGNGSGLTALAGANVTGQVANALVAGTVYTAAQPNITSVGTLSSLTVTGNVSAGNVSGTLLTGTLTTASQPNVTSVGTLTSLGVNGTVTAVAFTANTGVFTGNGSGLTALAGANVTGQVGNALVAGTVYTAAQPNITSVGTLTGLSVNGNITAANITANTGVFTGNGSGLSAIAGANVTGQVGNALVAGTVYTAAQPNITSVGTLTSLAVTGNTSAGNISTGGVLSVTGNANVGNIGAAAGVFTSVSGNGAALTALNASNISTGTLAQARLANSNVVLGSTTLTLGSTVTTVAGLTSVTSTTFVGALTGAATTAGTVTTAAQPNITSVGTLTSLSVSGQLTNANITTGANTTAGVLTGNWTLTAGSRLQATYADLAEKYVADSEYEVGTVLLFGGDHEVTIANEFDSHKVAGVVSQNAAYIMNAGCEGEHVVDLALTGRVPVKVHGPVAKGDLMVTGLDGHAVANNMARAGTILGKALQNFEGGSGIIEVVVGRV